MKDEQIRALIEDMSIEEKAGQLLQVAGNFYGKDSLVTGAIDYFKITEKELENAGSILSISGAQKLIDVQNLCMSKQPHHIPQVFMLDIINGFETIYPVPIGQGATFNPQLTQELAQMAAREGATAGVHATFSPMVDLVRDARWGRVMESTGEDSYLNGLMGAAMVRGYQGEDGNVSGKGRLAACVKHFAAYGGAEAGRDYDNVELSERTLREEYLPAYAEAVKAGAKMVMTSFNTINHVPSTGNKWLMKDVLRDEMGFDGMLITDYGATKEMVNHNIARDEEEAALLAIRAGVDMDMMSFCYVRGLAKLLEEGKITEDMIDTAVYRVLKLKNDLGLFENPHKDASVEEEKEIILCAEHRTLARRAAAESFVLLKNDDNTLPLRDKAGKIAFIGPYVTSPRVYGSWSFPSNDDSVITIKQGVQEYVENRKKANNKPVVFCEGSQFFGADYRLKSGEQFTYDADLAKQLLDEAIMAAKEADTVIMCIGEHSQQTGEAASRTELRIPDEQMKLFREVAQVNSNIVTLVFSGRPLELDEISQKSKAVMYMWFPGTECGHAAADVLWGEREPGGRLPMSFPYRATQEPCYYNRFRTGRPNNGTLNQSFVMGYIDQIDKMLYPFGYGKTYTTFQYSKVILSGGVYGDGKSLSKDKPITATVKLTNTGSEVGTETVQMYVSDLYGSVCRPVKQLRGFKKVTLMPGETQMVEFVIAEDMLRFYNIDMEYVSEPGECRVVIGADSETDNAEIFAILNHDLI